MIGIGPTWTHVVRSAVALSVTCMTYLELLKPRLFRRAEPDDRLRIALGLSLGSVEIGKDGRFVGQERVNDLDTVVPAGKAP